MWFFPAHNSNMLIQFNNQLMYILKVQEIIWRQNFPYLKIPKLTRKRVFWLLELFSLHLKIETVLSISPKQILMKFPQTTSAKTALEDTMQTSLKKQPRCQS